MTAGIFATTTHSNAISRTILQADVTALCLHYPTHFQYWLWLLGFRVASSSFFECFEGSRYIQSGRKGRRTQIQPNTDLRPLAALFSELVVPLVYIFVSSPPSSPTSLMQLNLQATVGLYHAALSFRRPLRLRPVGQPS
jgi:hypothetical protein